MRKRKFFCESIPQHRQIHLDARALRHLFCRGAAVIRYTCSLQEGDASFEYVCSEKTFSLQSLSPNARRRVRRGFEACDIRRVDFGLLARHGCPINQGTFARQGRIGPPWMTDDTIWKRYMLACASLSNAYAFGAFVKGQFCGFSITVTVDDYAYLFHTQALSEYLKYSPINALTYAVTKEMLAKTEIRHVSQGLESFKALPHVESFKLAMGFRKRSIGRRVVVNALARPLFSAPVVWLAKTTLGTFRPGLAEDIATFASALRTPKTRTAVVTN